MISAVCFVRKGVAKEIPEKYELNDEEYERICSMTKLNLEQARAELKNATQQASLTTKEEAQNDTDSLASFEMDNYDQEVTTQEDILMNNLTIHNDDVNEDPYVNLGTQAVDLDDEEREEVTIEPTDNMILVGRTEDDVSSCEVYVYNSLDDNLYVHHDFMLPSFPLCIEAINFELKEGSLNFCAVGTFSIEIELWNLDVLDAMYPFMILKDGHKDAVLSMSWNKYAKNMLASSSADGTVVVWDMLTQSAVNTLSRIHKGKAVSCIQFKQGLFMAGMLEDSALLLSGGYDGRVCISDVRKQCQSSFISSWNVKSDVECVAWDPFCSNRILAACEDGKVHAFDTRNISSDKHPGKAIFVVDAHTSSISSMCFNHAVPGMIMTASATSQDAIKVWDIEMYDNKQKPVRFIASKDTEAGKILTAQFCPDDPYLIALGGSVGRLCLWNVSEVRSIRERFHGRTIPQIEGTETMFPGGTVSMSMEGLSVVADVVKDIEDEEVTESHDLEMSDDEEELVETLKEMKGLKEQDSGSEVSN